MSRCVQRRLSVSEVGDFECGRVHVLQALLQIHMIFHTWRTGNQSVLLMLGFSQSRLPDAFASIRLE